MPASMDYLKRKWKNNKIKIIFNSLTSSPVSLEKSFEIYARYNLKQPQFKTPLSCTPITKKRNRNGTNG